ncbi:MAG TPA: hypothetical protein VGQ73_03830 [Gemmatimonadales bacterium]|jgi:hypothetical protein|nr:hypothetical protein [Gemmatimonadales bacterium]
MRQLLLFAHLLGFVLWLGGGLAAMNLGITMRAAPREDLLVMVRVMGRLHRGLLLPGVLLAVASGLLLTLRLYGSAMSTNGYPVALMVMQGSGLLAAGIVLGVSLPTVTRLGRLDPSGAQAPLFAALQQRARIAGALAGILAMTALVAGALMR